MWRQGKRCSADVYWSPTRDEGDITEHSDIDRIGEETVELFHNIPLRNDPSDGGGMEGMGYWSCDTTISTRILTCLRMPRPLK